MMQPRASRAAIAATTIAGVEGEKLLEEGFAGLVGTVARAPGAVLLVAEALDTVLLVALEVLAAPVLLPSRSLAGSVGLVVAALVVELVVAAPLACA